jgi:serine/threonine-protein kinase
VSDLQARLGAALGDTYRLDQELGGGGMSRVFLAEEHALGRKVVIKVLPPDMSAGVNRERFEREIKLAARLQHPHIVPLLRAGATPDVLYYVMPFIEGESLRARLARDGELPIDFAVQMLREVVDALSYAHAHEVVHRDIKPDNVLVTAGHAVVTDFGVAKAVSASSGGTRSSLTSLGVALGTPAYMSPEQAAGDPHVDHRADIYAVGALAYELLTGRPPFTGTSPQQVLAAHVTQQPEPVTQHRGTTPTELAQVVMRCLAKRAADRWQTAGELKAQLDLMATPRSGGITPTGIQPVASVSTHPGSAGSTVGLFVDTPLKVAAVFGATSAFVLLFVYALMIALGLPDWIFAGAVALIVIGLPIVMVTGRRERMRAVASLQGVPVVTPVGLERHFTWKKAVAGGGLAFAGLGVLAGVHMGARSLGIGPVATLASSGSLAEREPIVLAQLENRTQDASMGSTVTELLRVSLSQSPFVRLVDPARLNESLARMQRDPNTVIDESVALEMAERDAIKAVLAGEVVPLGDGFVISARLVAADGSVLTAHQASAGSTNEIMTAVDRLAAQLRERMGESLRTIRRTVPLDLVTTASIEALRLYTQALQAEIAGDVDRALSLLDEAIAQDSGFAMAYRKVGTILGNSFEQPARAMAAIAKAYELRERLTDLERGYTVAQYHTDVTGERENAIAAYRTILEDHPDDFRALNNTGVLYSQMRDWERALGFYQRALARDSTWSPGFGNVQFAQIALSRFEEAEATIDAMEERFPGNPDVDDRRATIAFARKDHDRADSLWTLLLERERASLGWAAYLNRSLGALHSLRGELTQARRFARGSAQAEAQRGLEANYLAAALLAARTELVIAQNPSAAEAIVEEALARYPVEEMAVPDRPYESLIAHFAEAGELDRARAVAADMERSGWADLGRSFQRATERARGWLASAEGDHRRALDLIRRGTSDRACEGCIFSDLARAHDAGGNADSAAYYWQAFVDTGWRAPPVDHVNLPTAYRRLGELYEQQGDREQAVLNYNELVELWSQADQEMQPQIEELRRRIASLVGEGR